jgi:hypothetical protein
MMAQTQLKETGPKSLTGEVDLRPKLINKLAGIVQEAEKPKRPEAALVSSWYYSVPCAGVRYYTYHQHQTAAK